MVYYRCKCGNREAFGSMPPPPCEECPLCLTTLETHPDLINARSLTTGTSARS